MNSMEQYKVSIIVPIYNVEKYLKRAVDSLLAQTMEGIEIILVDDGSPDSCGRMIDEYAERCSCCSALHKKNGGQSDARNAGMSIARGEYIGFVDPDDYVEPDMFEKLYQAAKENDSDLVLCGYIEEFSKDYIVEQKIKLNEKVTSGMSTAISFLKGDVGAYAWNKLFKKTIIERFHLQFPLSIMLSEDTVFFGNYLKYTNSVSVVGECLYHYIRNGESICAKYHARQYEYYLAGHDAKINLIDTLEKNNNRKLSRLREDCEVAFLSTCLNILDQLYSKGNKASMQKKKQELKKLCMHDSYQAQIRKYSGQITDIEQNKKIEWIVARKWNRLHIHQVFKMQIMARIKYYLG